MEEETLTAPVVEGAGPESPSTETQPEAQVPAETQPTAVPQVERNDNPPQAVETQRVKPSAYYRERERVRRLEEDSRRKSQEIEELRTYVREIKNLAKPEVSAIQKLTAEELLNDPEKALQMREQRYYSEINALKQELSQLKNKEAVTKRTKMEREALEMLFPKSSPDADEPLEDRLKNEDRVEMIDRVLKANPSLDRLSRIDPKGAAEFVLEKLSKQKPQTSPNAIPKSLMGSTARGNPSGGAKTRVSVDDVMADLKKLSKEMELNPSLRFDKDHKAKREQLIAEAERLAKENRG